jgi:hypothetical protein
VRLDQVDGAPILVGDETSLGLLLAWRTVGEPAAELIETEGTDPSVVGLDAVTTVGRDDLPAAVVAAAEAHPDAPLVLTGRAQSIAAVRRALKDAGRAGRPTKVKAYWDEGRKGLD